MLRDPALLRVRVADEHPVGEFHQGQRPSWPHYEGRMYGCNHYLLTIMNRALGKQGATMYGSPLVRGRREEVMHLHEPRQCDAGNRPAISATSRLATASFPIRLSGYVSA